jgi:hypothetical protein
MTRTTSILLAACAAALVFATPASARITEIGLVPDRATPSCPTGPCQAVSQVTAFQERTTSRGNVFVAPREGRIVAFTISLGTPSKKQIAFFDGQYGKASAGIGIIRPYRRRANNFRFCLNAQSEVFDLSPFFGQVVQFPLKKSLYVKKGYIVALTVPTWAPALAIGLDNNTAWRASRSKPCTPPYQPTPQTTPGSVKQYYCLYRQARITYSATEISTP